MWLHNFTSGHAFVPIPPPHHAGADMAHEEKQEHTQFFQLISKAAPKTIIVWTCLALI